MPAAIILLAACNTEKKTNLETDRNIVFTDTSLLNKANASTDVATNNIKPVEVVNKQTNAPKTQVRTITKIVRVIERQPAPKVTEKVAPPVVVATPTPASPSPLPSTGTAGNNGTSGTNGTAASTPVEKKKNTGWSQAAKGATIGGVGGAVAGAVIGKGGKGAVIGGVLGAAGGYILGRKADKKSGRIDYSY